LVKSFGLQYFERTRSRRRSCSQPKGVKIVEEIEETSDLETSHENEDEISHHEHDEEEEVPENVRFSVYYCVHILQCETSYN
jgi:hypothetical protein